MSDEHPPGPGRPRDPELERRALDATRRIYGEHGRKGVTFHQVAIQAEVGKPALYRRWDNPDDLIIDALADVTMPTVAGDVGDVVQELASFAEAAMTLLLSPDGAAVLRVITEFHSGPALFDRFMERVDAHVITGTHAIILRAIARGELPQTTSAEVVAAAVAGGALIEVLTRLQANEEPDSTEVRAFCESLARHAVAGARAV